MTAAIPVRTISWARVRAGRLTARFDFKLEGNCRGDFLMVGSAERSAAFTDLALEAFGRLEKQLPSTCSDDLQVEAGVCSFGAPPMERYWLLAVAHSVVLHLGAPEMPLASPPWTGETDDLPDVGLPVALGPSALHNLVRAAVGAASGEVVMWVKGYQRGSWCLTPHVHLIHHTTNPVASTVRDRPFGRWRGCRFP